MRDSVKKQRNQIKPRDYEVIDTTRKIIKKMAFKSYKFNSVKPFIVKQKIHYINNSFFVQVHLTNQADRCIFIESARFNCIQDTLRVYDLNEAEGVSIFDSAAVLQALDVRQYVFQLKPVD